MGPVTPVHAADGRKMGALALERERTRLRDPSPPLLMINISFGNPSPNKEEG